MNRKLLNRYKPNKRELALIDRQLDRLNDQLENVPEVSGKVTKSSRDFPYIEEHMTVRMAEPKAATAIKDRIREKEARRKVLLKEIKEVDEYILSLPEDKNQQVLEMFYLFGEKQCDIADALGITQGRVSQIIQNVCKTNKINNPNVL